MKKQNISKPYSGGTAHEKLTNKKLKKLEGDSDEYYTPKYTVECILDVLNPKYIKDKIIYCPCDAEWSNFVIVLKEQKDKLGYKELIYTSDDFRTHGDLFDKADLIITNPPFSLYAEWVRFLNEHNCKFVSISTGTSCKYALKYNYYSYVLTINKKLFLSKETEMFYRPKNSDRNFNLEKAGSIKYSLIYSDKDMFYKKLILPYIRLIEDYGDKLEYFDNYRYNGEQVLNINYSYDLPLDYNGYFGLPSTFVQTCHKLLDNIQFLELVKDTTVNGKKKFARACCKWKDFSINQQYINQDK